MLTYKNIKLSDEDRVQIIQAKTRLFSKKTEEEMFYELCFCICSPQTTFSKNSELNKELKSRDFFRGYIPSNELELLTAKVRFYQRKALFLIEAKKKWRTIYDVMVSDESDYFKRDWLIQNVRGLGFKTSSHFLRNALGCEYFAILDTHVCKFLETSPPKSPTMYKTQEARFMEIANDLSVTPMELDIYIFAYYSGQDLNVVR